MPPVPISDYALLSNCQGSALVDRHCSVDWLCLPRFDSATSFAHILGHGGGHWRLHPSTKHSMSRSYIDGTLVLQTEFKTRSGTVRVSDALVTGPAADAEQIGLKAEPALIRIVEGLDGTVEMASELAPRPEYGLTSPMWFEVDGGAVSRGGPMSYMLSTQVPFDLEGSVLKAEFKVSQGDKVSFGLRVDDPWLPPVGPWSTQDLLQRFDESVAVWQAWSEQHNQRYDGAYGDEVRRSALILQALTYSPTRAIVAAATTSLPEWLGGTRNWDYRYAWVRDSSLTVNALCRIEDHYKAFGFFAFFINAAGGRLDERHELQIMYGIGGERFLPEATMDHLTGYKNSAPVRVGNGAWSQTQLDIYGELLTAAYAVHELTGRDFDGIAKEFLVSVADRAAERWLHADAGIWEVRGGGGNSTYSKVMCWAALHKATRMADMLGVTAEKTESWQNTMREIRDAILAYAWSDKLQAYSGGFGEDYLDASVLMMPIMHFLPATDPRMRATIEVIAKDLTDDNGFVYRYRVEDGLPGGEGTFGICTYWLVTNLALLGETDRARKLYERASATANDLGLQSEELDPNTGEMLGNFPQAFTHIGSITAALAIDLVEKGEITDGMFTGTIASPDD